MQAMHARPVRIAPVPAPRTRYVSHAAERRAPERPRVGKTVRVEQRGRAGSRRPVVEKTAHEPRRSKHQPQPRLKAVAAIRREPQRIPPAIPRAEPLTPVVNIIRQSSFHPQLPPVEEVASTTMILPSLYESDGRLAMPPALRGSHDILVRQNLMADQDGLTRVQDDEDLLRLRTSRDLVAIPVNQGLRIDERLPWDRRFCRPWVAQFLVNLGQAHYNQFHTPLQVNSAVRTVAFQVKLIRTNGNAAQPDGEAASPHLTGQAVDIGKRGLSQAEIAWMRLYLQGLIDQSVIDVEEEFQQACFHLSVYRRYAPPMLPEQKIASTHRPLSPAIAAAIE